MVGRLENELDALRTQFTERENDLNSRIEEQRQQITELQKEHE